MRTFLTYVLAALAAATASLLVRWLTHAVAVTWYASNVDMSGDVMTVSEAAWVFTQMMPMLAFGYGLIFSALWVGADALLQSVNVWPIGPALVLKGAALSLIASVVLSIGIEGAEGGLSDSLGDLLYRRVWTWMQDVAFGTAWGTVFWMRAPKPETTGIAA